MKKNIGTFDRVLRFLFGVLLAVLAWREPSLIWRGIFGLGSLFCFYQAATSWCALYALLGKNTCPIEIKK